MIFSYFLKRYGTNLQSDTKLETTSCFIAEKVALEERSLVQEVYGKLIGGVIPSGSVSNLFIRLKTYVGQIQE